MSCEKQVLDIRFKVVRISNLCKSSANNNHEFFVHIFCSETGKWSGLIKFLLPCALPDLELSWSVQSVATNGTLHWLLGEKMSDQIKGILAINPFKFNFGVGSTSTTITNPQWCRSPSHWISPRMAGFK